MMRKDVKLGFAIGGVLLAVLVVYVLVGTGNDKAAAPGTANVVTQDNPSDNTKLADNVQPSHDGSALGAGALTDKSQDLKTTKIDPGVASKDAGKNAGKDPWGTVLNEGHLMLSETPDATNTKSAGATSATDIPGGGTRDNRASQPTRANLPADAMLPDSGAADSSGPTTQPSRGDSSSSSRGTSQRTHVIQKGETFASIAQMAYGSASYSPAIQRANSSLDPKKLKPGTTIILPPTGDVKPGARASDNASAGLASASMDSKTQYRVEAGDTLERIAVKLYGKREMKDKIYELNKDTIGADPNKLKLNQMLKLPSAPTNSH